jgi:diacylglycerol kinase (ATP)
VIRVIWNPVSGRGRGARLHAAVRTAFAAQGITDFQATTAPGDEAHLVHQALDDGVATIVAVGGDGTWGKCAVALAKAGSPARIAFVAAGTGNDFAKNLRAPAHNLHAMAQLIAGGGVERRVDLGRVDDAWFANVAGLGFDVAALRAATRVRFLRGSSVYVVAALRELFDFPGLEARVQGMAGVDPQPMLRRLMLVIANGKEFGGAFRIAPEARVDDGRLDAVLFADGIRAGRLPLLARALVGAHLKHPAVASATGTSFTITCRNRPWLELDGELHQATSEAITVACVPGALRVLDTSDASRTRPGS